MNKILLIEDDPYIVNLYARMLTLEKFEVEIASNGKDGVAKARQLQPDLILLDIMMPVMNGLEALYQLKADEATKNIIVLILTNSGEDSWMAAKGLGANDYLIKSNFSPNEVLDKIRESLH